MFYPTEYDQRMSQATESKLTNNENSKRTSRTTTTTAAIKPNKQLPEKAIRIMNAWYLAHEDNPYPNRNDLDYLATNGEIKEAQVKAWFSNKRNRTQNTHPKRAKRYLIRTQTQLNSTSWNEPEKIHLADDLEQRAHLLQPSHPLPSSSSHWSCLPSHSYDYYAHQYYYSQ